MVLAGVTGVLMPSDNINTPSTETAAHEPGSTDPPKGRNACSKATEEVSRANTPGVRRADRTGVCGMFAGDVAIKSGAGGALLSCEFANCHRPPKTIEGRIAKNIKPAMGLFEDRGRLVTRARDCDIVQSHSPTGAKLGSAIQVPQRSDCTISRRITQTPRRTNCGWPRIIRIGNCQFGSGQNWLTSSL